MPKQRFTAPGTWTCPPTVTFVRVFAVGGGGGGSGASLPYLPAANGAGGGGGAVVERHFVPVSGPVPVTIGAGGTAGVATYPQPAPGVQNGGLGGTSAFGPLGPGPVALIPPTTVAAGGGGGGIGKDEPRTLQPLAAVLPEIGGAGGGTVNNAYNAGVLGAAGGSGVGGGAMFLIDYSQFGAPAGGSYGYRGFGGGGSMEQTTAGIYAGSRYANAKSNYGGGGRGGQNPAGSGGAGGSGVVIVEWFQ